MPRQASDATRPSAADQELLAGVLAREPRALAKTLTLIESTRAEHGARAQRLLEALAPHTGGSIRVGLSGPPGAGKSTLVEALGLHLAQREHRVAVLAIDPSSPTSGGSILGDKTRMERLSRHERAFIRPSPARGAQGGTAEKTREAMLACEAAGFDVVLVETVGAGQSQTAVAGMVDVLVLLQLPHTGDDLQAVKKGIVELADIVVYSKADLHPGAIDSACEQARAALELARAGGRNGAPAVLKASALCHRGIDTLWREIERLRKIMEATGELAERRRRQSLDWMWALIESGLQQGFREHPAVRRSLPQLARAVERGETTPAAAARRLLGLHAVGEPEISRSGPRR